MFVVSDKFKCSMEQYAHLQRLRDNVIKLKVEQKNAEGELQYYLNSGNMELAKLVSDRVNLIVKEIRISEKDIENLESTCFITP